MKSLRFAYRKLLLHLLHNCLASGRCSGMALWLSRCIDRVDAPTFMQNALHCAEKEAL